ncbi:hypothetical protein [Sinanaerobacter chloroacetimidivorans]|jgi:ferredoxin-NADP reductase|uniref:Uncharacterized protein n=1 Tax=Sinanaerobacter chloroacetimidivorans TaxID=2818044 RepID=A0A8J8B3C2_9FIRM|nr:hypothetical protein [Sinanaerobacter chloroacetimidivorans]MBR0600204.1 hypothetical protein [Sinanaerobacter chloroacetimidivorans]
MVMNCIDAGSENCPCYLALTGDCLTCSRLQGKDYCDCSWRGVCIYNEFKQLNGKINNPRKDFEVPIVERRTYMDDLVVFVLNVGKGFAIKASRPGSYLFMKTKDALNFYEVPISVMKADVEKGYLHLGVKIISAKTKALLQEEDSFVIRGPYRNGLQGIQTILGKRVPGHSVLVLAKGIGIAPAILACQYLCHRRIVDMVIDTEKISKELISDYLDENTFECYEGAAMSSGIIKYLPFSEEEGKKEIEALMKEKGYHSVIILTSDYYIETLGKLAKEILPHADLAMSNNFRICCGEGLCGSCSLETVTGDTIKMCKCQLTGEELLEKRASW